MTAEQVYTYIGGFLNVENKNPNPDYQDSCALRLSIAFSRYGTDFSGEAGAVNIKYGNKNSIGGKSHVVITARSMLSFQKRKLGAPTYSNFEDYEKDDHCDEILIWGDTGHVGMGPSENLQWGSVRRGEVWVYKKDNKPDQ